jgi:nucleoside-diphosphate-sugar epimerase
LRALVTGASGFVGRALCERLAEEGAFVRAVTRRDVTVTANERIVIDNIDERTDWSRALDSIDTVFHAGAVAHIISPTPEHFAQMHRTNVLGTAALAQAARGIERFVYVSSAKVGGESSGARPLRESDPPAPSDAYGRSKWEGEQAVRAVSPAFSIVRPPLVYGPGVRANFLSLLKVVDRGIPLPLGFVDNRRSLVYVRNLADALVTVARTPGETFYVSDGEDLSTAELIRRMAAALGKKPRLLPVPLPLLRMGARFAPGLNKLTGTLQVDTTRLREQTGWRPPFTVDEGLAATAKWLTAPPVSPRSGREGLRGPRGAPRGRR